jgi:hypothetical protein
MADAITLMAVEVVVDAPVVISVIVVVVVGIDGVPFR